MTRTSPLFILRATLRRWPVVLVCFVASVGLAVGYIFAVPWRYESEALLVVKTSNSELNAGINPTANTGDHQSTGEVIRRAINTRLAVLRSRDVATEALNDIGLVNAYPDLVAAPPRFFGTAQDAGVERMTNDFAALAEPNSNGVQVSFIGRNPQVARDGLLAIIQVFLRKDGEFMRASHVAFLRDQVKQAGDLLRDMQTRIVDFKEQHGITDVAEERTLLLRQRDLIDQNLAAENTQSLQMAMTSAQAQVTQSEQDYLRSKQRFAPGSEMAKRAEESATLARSQYVALLRLMANGPRGSADTAALYAVWRKQKDDINKRLADLAKADPKLVEYQRHYDLQAKLYVTLSQKLQDAEIIDANDRQVNDGVVLAQQPTLPYKPSKPNFKLLIGLGVLAGLGGGIALAVMLESSRITILSPEQIPQLVGVPVLATLNRRRAMRGISSMNWLLNRVSSR